MAVFYFAEITRNPQLKVYSVLFRDIETFQVMHVIAQEYINDANIFAVSLFLCNKFIKMLKAKSRKYRGMFE